jgi:hypothetical protein
VVDGLRDEWLTVALRWPMWTGRTKPKTAAESGAEADLLLDLH